MLLNHVMNIKNQFTPTLCIAFVFSKLHSGMEMTLFEIGKLRAAILPSSVLNDDLIESYQSICNYYVLQFERNAIIESFN